MKLTIEDEDGYQIKATRELMGTFMLVSIEWKHPNWSHFSDDMLWVNSVHLNRWVPIAVSESSKRYRMIEDFLKEFPYFSPLFSEI